MDGDIPMLAALHGGVMSDPDWGGGSRADGEGSEVGLGIGWGGGMLGLEGRAECSKGGPCKCETNRQKKEGKERERE